MTREAALRISRRQLLQCAAPVLAGGLAWPAQAQSSYPDRPIRLVVPFPPGALTDSIGRLVAERLRPALNNQPIVVENRPGAGTLLGAGQVAKAAPDGHSLIVATSTTLAISPAMFPSPPAVASDFVGVAMIGSVSLLLVTRPDLPARGLADLIGAVRKEPGRFNYGSPGKGTMHHLLFEMLGKQEALQLTHVPYQGSMAALSDLLTGRIDFMFIDAVAGLPQIQARKANVLAIAAPQRMAVLPDVPTVAEVFPSVDIQAWQAIAAPKGTPTAVVQKLNTELNRLLETDEVRTTLLRYGVTANPMSTGALNALIGKDEKRFGEMVRAAGLSPS